MRMCGRFALDDHVVDAVDEWVDADGKLRAPARWLDPTTVATRYSITPQQSIAVMHYATIGGEQHRALTAARWGFAPPWAAGGRAHPINARLETVATNGMFRTAFRTGRCVVPMSGYFEWLPVSDGKQPYYISRHEPLFASAVATRDRDDNVTVAIITRAAVDASGQVHDRMPAFLELAAIDEWLAPETPRTEGDLALLDKQSLAVASTLSTHAVSRSINNARTADPSDKTLVEPV